MTAWDETFDVVIAGYGFAGAIAAITAHDAGARVLLVEKMSRPGGISVCSGGGIRMAEDADAAFAYLSATCAGTTPEGPLRALARGMTEVEAQVRDLARINDANVLVTKAPGNYPFDGHDRLGYVSVSDIPGFNPNRDIAGASGLRGGARLFKMVSDNVAARAIEVRLGTPAGRVIRDGDQITGFAIGAEERSIRATGGVILACGGFEADDEMKMQYFQGKPVLAAVHAGNTGDGIRMAQAAGADLWHMWHYHGTYGFRHVDPAYPYGIRTPLLPLWTPGLEEEDKDYMKVLAGQRQTIMPWIVVDQDGRRYMNEYPPYVQDTGHRPMEFYEPETQRYPRIPSWLIVDDAGRQLGPMGQAIYNDPAVDFAWSDDNLAEVDLGILGRTDSVDGLAAAIDVDPTVLATTINRWNVAVDAGDDTDFGRRAEGMAPIRTPPFFHAQIWPIVANTQGGPVHDARQRILDPFGKAIPGLYAAGELGSVFGHLYLAGSNLTECFVGGRTAGLEAASEK